MRQTELETRRLLLRPVAENHAAEIYLYFDEQVTRYMEPVPFENLRQAQAAVERFVGQREAETDFVYAVTSKFNRKFIGIAALHNVKSEHPELGVWIAAPYHGCHYGREAVGGLQDLGRRMGLKALYYPVDIRNIPSQKIPLFYGGRIVNPPVKTVTRAGRVLWLATYQICL